MNKKRHYRICSPGQEAEMEVVINNSVGGLPRPIVWESRAAFSTAEEAKEYLESQGYNYTYDERAVRYFVKAEFKQSSRLMKLEERKNTAHRKLRNIENDIYYKDTKATRITCRYCGSHLASNYLNRYGNKCPVCFSDLRPKSVLEKLEKYKENYQKLYEEYNALYIQECEKSISKKPKTEWLIKYEW